MSKHFFLVAGEASGDKLGANLMVNLKAIDPNVRFSGVGGPKMIQQGLNSLFEYEELSVMGIIEVLPRLPNLLRRIRTTANVAASCQPDAVITIDSPDFTLRVAKQIRALEPNLPIIHYVCPSIWAWRDQRAKKMHSFVDHVLTLLNFEPKILKQHGIDATFVGHPAVEDKLVTINMEIELRSQLGINKDDFVLLVLPGSRKNEIKRLTPVFGEVVSMLICKYPDVKVIVPVANSVREQVSIETQKWNVQPTLFFSDQSKNDHSLRQKDTLFFTSNFALAASGTVTLELAAANTLHIVAYDFNLLSRYLLDKMVAIDSINLINIIFGKKVIPELIGNKCEPKQIFELLEYMLFAKDKRNEQKAAFKEVTKLISAPDKKKSGQIAAETVFDLVNKHQLDHN